MKQASTTVNSESLGKPAHLQGPQSRICKMGIIHLPRQTMLDALDNILKLSTVVDRSL